MIATNLLYFSRRITNGCLCILVAEVTFANEECGKITFNKVIKGSELVSENLSVFVTAIKPDCEHKDVLESKENFCLLADKAAINEQGVTLDNRSLLLRGSCDVTCETTSGSAGFRTADESTNEIPADNTEGEKIDDSKSEEEKPKSRTVNRQGKQKGTMTGMERSVNVSDSFKLNFNFYLISEIRFR